MKIALVVNLSKPKALQCAESIIDLFDGAAELLMPPECGAFFSGYNVSFCESPEQLFEESDVAVTVGGDGTIIHAAKYAAVSGTPIIGVNVGRLGFVTDVETDSIIELKKLLSGDFHREKRTLLDVYVIKNGKESRYLAINDAVVAHGQLSKIVDLQLFLNGEEISKYRADGLLFSTPTGSTAYSLSAGGPIVAPQMECILMTPVCPHSLFSRSVLFEGGSRLSVKAKIPEGCSCVLTVDGEINIDISELDEVVIQQSDLRLEFLSIHKRNFYRKLNEKLKEREL